MCVAPSIGETSRRCGFEVEGPHQKCCHLGSGDGPVGTVLKRLLGAACGDAGCVQCFDAGGVHAVGVYVGEPGGLGGRFETEHSGQKGCHLGSGDGPVGTEAGFVATAVGDALFGQPHDVIGEEAAGDVAEHGERDCAGEGLAAGDGDGDGDRVDASGWGREGELLSVA